MTTRTAKQYKSSIDFLSTLDATNTSDGALRIDGGISVQKNSYFGSKININSYDAYGALEIGGVSGGYLDLKSPFTDDYDLRLITTGTGGSITLAAGASLDINNGSHTFLTASSNGGLALSSVKTDSFIDFSYFGAVGDGITDDTSAIQRALDATDIKLKCSGKYLITNTLSKTNGSLCIEGNGWETGFVFNSAGSFSFAGGDASDYYNTKYLELNNCSFRTNSNVTKDVITASWTGGAGSTAKTVVMNNVSISGIDADSGWGSGSALNLSNATNSHFNNVYINGLRNGNRAGNGILITGDYNGVSGGAPVDNYITNCSIYFCEIAIKTSGWVEGIHVNSCTIVSCRDGLNCVASPAGRPFIDVSSSHINTSRYGITTSGFLQMIFSNNLFYGQATDGVDTSYAGLYIYLNGTGAKGNNTLISNTFYGIIGTSKNAIVLAGDDDHQSLISHNIINNCDTGIWLQTNVHGVIVKNSNVFNSCSNTVLDSGYSNKNEYTTLSFSSGTYLFSNTSGTLGINTTSPSNVLSISGNLDVSNLFATSSTIGQFAAANISAATLSISNSIGTVNIATTNISTATLSGTSSTVGQFAAANISAATLSISNSIGTVNIATTNISSTNLNVGAATITNNSGYGTIELGGSSGAYLDLKAPSTDDYDLRLISGGAGGSINIQLGSSFDISDGTHTFIYAASTGNVGIGDTNPQNTLSVNGSISKLSGTFNIPHPILAGKRLVHSFIEGPRCDLIYRGETTLVLGTATVNLNSDSTSSAECGMSSGTFEALVKNTSIFLQNKTGYNLVKGSLNGATLTISSQNPLATDTISWMVVGERKDTSIVNWECTNSSGSLITEMDG